MTHNFYDLSNDAVDLLLSLCDAYDYRVSIGADYKLASFFKDMQCVFEHCTLGEFSLISDALSELLEWHLVKCSSYMDDDIDIKMYYNIRMSRSGVKYAHLLQKDAKQNTAP